MAIYSNKIIQFLAEIKHASKNILSKDVRLKVFGDRFYDHKRKNSYPIQIVIFNDRNMLGYFDPTFYELGFHERLMYSSKEQLHEVIKHELAHYITFITHGEGVQAHGSEFRAFCQSMGWGEEVYKATSCLEGEHNHSGVEESTVLRKVKKLMALAASNNENEAEQAMIKSQQLLIKHHIESKYIGVEEDEKMVLKRLMKQKRIDSKMRAIANILQTFFVHVVFRRAEEVTCLEVLGSAVNVEIAEYVASFLEKELDQLWNVAQRMGNVKGRIAKNSFFLGLAKGYCNKIKALKKTHSSDEANALMVIEKKLFDATNLVYRRLSSAKSHAGYCSESSALGEQMGRKLNIHPAIDKSSRDSPLLLK
jgi:Protein of unknown function (DUF2786)/SprT-like family